MADTDRDRIESDGEGQYRFMQETFKDEVSKSRKIWKFIWRTAAHGLVFGIAACIAFYILQPWASEFFGKKGATVDKSDGESVEAWSEEDYEEMRKAIYQVADQARTSVVEISAVSAEIEDEERPAVSGLIVWKDRTSVEILASSSILNENQDLRVRFVDDTSYPIDLKIQDKNLQMALFTVHATALDRATWDAITCAKWSDADSISQGTFVLCLGEQFGYQEGVGDGTINAVNNHLSLADKNYDILTTNISAAQPGATGILFNMDGEVVGIADQNTAAVKNSSLINAYVISDMKREIDFLLNGRHTPYLGICGIDVTEEIHDEKEIPMGVYVKKVESDSPAMKAGIRSGDVIVNMNQQDVTCLKEYSQILQEMEQYDKAQLVVMRRGSAEYVEVNIEATVGMKR